jgi:hypothetical protein
MANPSAARALLIGNLWGEFGGSIPHGAVSDKLDELDPSQGVAFASAVSAAYWEARIKMAVLAR